MIQHGDEGELVSLMQDIVDENFSKRELSFSMKQQLVFCFRATALRALKGETIIDDRGDMFGQLDSFATLDQTLGYIININKALCKRNREQRAAQEAALRCRLKQYVDAHYADPELTIYHVCHEFHINEQQAYKLFRDCLGATFAETIETMRIRRACELLAEGGSAVKDIAEQVGYANDNSFGRAFKRVLGISPSEYMNSRQ